MTWCCGRHWNTRIPYLQERSVEDQCEVWRELKSSHQGSHPGSCHERYRSTECWLLFWVQPWYVRPRVSFEATTFFVLVHCAYNLIINLYSLPVNACGTEVNETAVIVLDWWYWAQRLLPLRCGGLWSSSLSPRELWDRVFKSNAKID